MKAARSAVALGRDACSVRQHIAVGRRSRCCCLHTTSAKDATPVYPTRPGPPPNPPVPSAEFPGEKVERARKKAQMLQMGQQLKANPAKPATALQRRFWKDVHVVESEDGYQVYLDKRPVRTPNTKVALTLPRNKRNLATAIALEWDNLSSAQQALKTHFIPLTSLTSRAIDIETADKEGRKDVRDSIVQMLMGYLATDTLLCWAPERSVHDSFEQGSVNAQQDEGRKQNLRSLQEDTAKPILAHLTTYIWPGVELRPTLDPDSILPQAQPEMSMQIIRGWLTGLGPWDLAALERAVLAGKSLLVGTRMLVEWSDAFADVRQAWRSREGVEASRFGIEDAAEACSLEVLWQTKMWGEVEDTHDVEREDIRRQLGSAVLMVHGA